MSDLVGNPEDRFSHNEAHVYPCKPQFHDTKVGFEWNLNYISMLVYCSFIHRRQNSLLLNRSRREWLVRFHTFGKDFNSRDMYLVDLLMLTFKLNNNIGGNTT